MIDPWNVYIDKNYVNFIDKTRVKVIFEIGARECGYTQDIINCYNFCEEIHCFECNPYTIDACKKNINQLQRPNKTFKKIILNPLGLSSCKEKLNFFPVLVDGDYGSSSAGFFPTEKAHSLISDRQCEIECITIDDYCKKEKIKSIDLMCIDIEGNELKAFQGAKEILHTTSYIITETQDVRRNENTPLRSEISDYLLSYGFKEAYTTCDGYFGDSLYINENHRHNTAR
jgi:FkbM family methyltransferase